MIHTLHNTQTKRLNDDKKGALNDTLRTGKNIDQMEREDEEVYFVVCAH